MKAKNVSSGVKSNVKKLSPITFKGETFGVPHHTPTPWRVSIDNEVPTSDRIIENEDGMVICRRPSLADAAFIVRAVNAYHRHSEALGRILALCEKSSTGDPMVEVYEIVRRAMDSYDVQEANAKGDDL